MRCVINKIFCLYNISRCIIKRLFLPRKLGVFAYAALALMRMSRGALATEGRPAQS